MQHSHSHRPSAAGEHMGPVPVEVDSHMAEAVVLHLAGEDTLQDCIVQADSAEEQGPIQEVEEMSWSGDNNDLLHMGQRLLGVGVVVYTALDHIDLRMGHSPHRFRALLNLLDVSIKS